MLALIDNYDSFTFNLVHYFEALGGDVRVFRNDQVSVAELRALAPTHVVIFPAPARPPTRASPATQFAPFPESFLSSASASATNASPPSSVAGSCRAAEPVYGKTSEIHHHASPPFNHLPSPFTATRYHSLVVDPASLPPELRITARTDTGEIMGLCHTRFTAMGVQFHPESILTEHGLPLLQNFLAVRGGVWHE